MKKYIAALIIMLMIPVTVFAHSGGTDSNGGHYDHSTGKYHYHHGYPAHDHYDMDGDGTVDCPYDFDDRTGWNSGSNTNKNKAQSQTAPKNPAGSTNASEKEVTSLQVTGLTWVLFAFSAAASLGVIVLVLWIIKAALSFLEQPKHKKTALLCFVAMLSLCVVPFFLVDYTGNFSHPSINGKGFLPAAVGMMFCGWLLATMAGGMVAVLILLGQGLVKVFKDDTSKDIEEPWGTVMWISFLVPHIPMSILVLLSLFGIIA